MPLLTLQNLHVSANSHPILNGVDLTVSPGEVHLIVGPNGSGKSTLAQTIMGLPQFTVTEGSIALHDADITNHAMTDRARAGIYLAYQHPVAIPGLPLFNLCYATYQAMQPKDAPLLNAAEFYTQKLLKPLTWLNMSEEMIQRAVNDDLSGGEKKKTEIFQLLALGPALAVLDEIDSGLDRDAVKVVFEAIAKWRTENPDRALIVISHHPAIAELITPDYVHVMMEGNIILSGGTEVLESLQENGFDALTPDSHER